MFKYLQTDSSHSALCHPSKQGIAHFTQQHVYQSQRTVSNNQGYRHCQRGNGLLVEVVDGVF